MATVTTKQILKAAAKVPLAVTYGNEDTVLDLVRMICVIDELVTTAGVVYTESYLLPKGSTASRDHAILAWRLKAKV